MTTNEIRRKFLEFFKSKKHTIIPSDSLVPKDDPTVLFTTAGMQQFKPQFMGVIDGYTRATSCQKCLRTDDLDVVGKTDCHHTFFEMLGNFSFGDYFKKEAIEWAWEFFTEVLKISEEKLWVSVYKDDIEAEIIWLEHIKLPRHRLVRLGDKSNFWPANAKQNGPNGPCGPCSEIFYDYGVNPACTNPHCDPDCSCGRFTEVWNLVFTQFNRKDGGILEPLPAKNIDTGMGLERLAAVMQGKKSNYDTDLFEPILHKVKELLPTVSVTESRIVADHMRAIIFGISDGVVPSNEGRGYVIKKLIITVSDLAITHGPKEPLAHKLVAAVIDAMSAAYPELTAKSLEIAENIRNVEEGYLRVRKERIPEYIERVTVILRSPDSMDNKVEKLGDVAFLYRDTYGLTMDSILTATMTAGAAAQLSAADLQTLKTETPKQINKHMDRQREKSRASSKMTGDVFSDANLKLNVPKTKFVGYEHASAEGEVLKLFIGQQEVSEVREGDVFNVILNQTPFYAESGGQVGDTGTLWASKIRVKVTDTQKVNDIFIHSAVVEEGHIRIGDKLSAQIDEERRFDIMRNHTATHILQAVLREILGPHVKQQGSLVSQDRLRFDFTHLKAIGADELKLIEDKANKYIIGCHQVTKEVMSLEKAKHQGALAFFAEKYGETVRVVSIGQFSKEFCGGTHLNITGQIGPLKIVSEGAVAQGIRRIEAVTGLKAFEYIYERETRLNRIAEMLKTPTAEIVGRVEQQAKYVKKLEKDLETAQFSSIEQSVGQILEASPVIRETKLVAHTFSNVTMDTLRRVSDLIKQKTKSAVIVLGSKTSEDAHVLIAVTDDVVERGIKAGDLIKQIAPIMGGSGGGRPQLAQAGSKNPGKVAQAIEQSKTIIKEKMSV